MATTIIDKLITVLGFDLDASGLNKASQRLDKFGKSARQVGQSFGLYLTAPIVAAGTAALKAASDAEETQNRFAEVFKGIEKDAQNAADELSKGFGLAGVTSQELLSDVGDLLVGLGVTRSEALAMAKDVVTLSGDVASFKNVQGGTARTTIALTKALLGEREMLKDTFKTSVLESEVKERANLILAEQTDLTEKQAKAMATLQIVTERNADAVGDFARTSGGAANQTRIFQENMRELGVIFGRDILPIFTKLIMRVNEFLKGLRDLSPETRELIVTIAAVAAVIGPALILIGAMASGIAALGKGVLLAVAAFKSLAVVGTIIKAALVLPFAPVLGIIGAVTAAIVALITYFDIDLFGALGRAFDYISGLFTKVGDFLGLTGDDLEVAAAAPAGTTTPVAPGATTNTQTNAVEVGTIEINAQGADSREIAQNVGGALRDQLQNTAQDFNSQFAR